MTFTPTETVSLHPCRVLESTKTRTHAPCTDSSIELHVHLKYLLLISVTFNVEKISKLTTWNKVVLTRIDNSLKSGLCRCIVFSEQISLTCESISKTLGYTISTCLITLIFTLGKITISCLTLRSNPLKVLLLRHSTVCRKSISR